MPKIVPMPYLSIGNVELWNDDCVKVMRSMEADSFDAIVCDPPYGLSNDSLQGVTDGLFRVLCKVGFPNLAQFDAELSKQVNLSGIPLDGSPLCRRRLAGIESGVFVPKRPVDLQGDIVLREVEVNTRSVSSSVCVPNSILRNKLDATRGEFLGHYVFDLRDSIEPAVGNSFGSGVAEFSAGFIGVPVVTTLLPGFGCALSAFALSNSSGFCDFVGLDNDTFGKSKRPTSVVTDSGAVDSFVLRFDVSGRSIELSTARRAGKADTGTEARCPKLVAARSAASCLSAKLQPHRVSVVINSANGTRSAYFVLWLRTHSLWTSLESIIPSGGFMGKGWDNFTPGKSVWAEALRVAKPGAHLLAFGGTRTFHRLACAIEDAGWEIRDCVMWMYGSGFPKSANISKMIDKKAGAEREKKRTPMGPTGNKYAKGLGDPRPWMEEAAAKGFHEHAGPVPVTAAARQWDGWGTALKPSFEPVIMARKPLIGTVIENVLRYGTGGINIDGSKVGTEERWNESAGNARGGNSLQMSAKGMPKNVPGLPAVGRWPANLIHDGSEEVVALFPREAGGETVARIPRKALRKLTGGQRAESTRVGIINGDSGSAARFFKECPFGSADRLFYTAKASSDERPTVRLDGVETIMVQLLPKGGDSWESAERRAVLRVDTVQFPPKGIVGCGAEYSTDPEWNTLLFGSGSMAQFLRATKSTIKTKTSSTTESKTLNWLVRSLINASIPVVRYGTGNGGSRAESAETPNLSELLITLGKSASLPGVSNAALGTQLRISASAIRSYSTGHPTVKPISLMVYLVNLVTPPGAIVLDPFTGSGSTGLACVRLKRRFVGIERELEYCKIAERRIGHVIDPDKYPYEALNDVPPEAEGLV